MKITHVEFTQNRANPDNKYIHAKVTARAEVGKEGPEETLKQLRSWVEIQLQKRQYPKTPVRSRYEDDPDYDWSRDW